MFLALELQTSGLYVSQHAVALFKPSKFVIRDRNIALRDEYVVF